MSSSRSTTAGAGTVQHNTKPFAGVVLLGKGLSESSRG